MLICCWNFDSLVPGFIHLAGSTHFVCDFQRCLREGAWTVHRRQLNPYGKPCVFNWFLNPVHKLGCKQDSWAPTQLSALWAVRQLCVVCCQPLLLQHSWWTHCRKTAWKSKIKGIRDLIRSYTHTLGWVCLSHTNVQQIGCYMVTEPSSLTS